MTIYTAESGKPFNAPHNKVRNSVAGTWTVFGEGTTHLAVNVVGVYYGGSQAGDILQLRDNEDDIWYTFTSSGNDEIDYLTNPLPVYTSFDYHDNAGGNVIIIYGVYA